MRTITSIGLDNQIKGQVGHRQTTTTQMAVNATGMVTGSHQVNLVVATMKNRIKDLIKTTVGTKTIIMSKGVQCPTLMKFTSAKGVLKATAIKGDQSFLPLSLGPNLSTEDKAVDLTKILWLTNLEKYRHQTELERHRITTDSTTRVPTQEIHTKLMHLKDQH